MYIGISLCRSERIEFRRKQRLERNAANDEDWGTPSPPNKATATGRGQQRKGKTPAPMPPGLSLPN